MDVPPAYPLNIPPLLELCLFGGVPQVMRFFQLVFKVNFSLLLKLKSKFDQNSEIPGRHFCASMRLCTQPATLGGYLRFFQTEMFSMYENCDCFKFPNVTLTYSPSDGFWQSFVTIGSCNHLMRIISTYVGNTRKSEIF